MAKSSKKGPNPRGGVHISGGTVNTGGGDVFGGNKTVNLGQLEQALRPVSKAIDAAPHEKRIEALSKLDELKKEAAKGEKSDDSVVAKLVHGLVGLVPGAASAVVGAFGSPILGAIAGKFTKSVLGDIQGE